MAKREAIPEAARVLAQKLAERAPKKQRLRRTKPSSLTIRRQRRGTGFRFLTASGAAVRDAKELRRLQSLAMPPAYEDVRYADDPQGHLQAIGTDAAGRTQYRYHPDWEKVRERRKARRLVELIAALPRIRRAVTQQLRSGELTKDFVCAAVIELISCTAMRPGSESYARDHGTRGAATLLKSNVTVKGSSIALAFRAKGGQNVARVYRDARLAKAIKKLDDIPGRRLFQYRDEEGSVRFIRRRDVNDYLRAAAGVKISLKDIRTLTASAAVLETLAKIEPAKSQSKRKRQMLDAVRAAAEELNNTPAVCRRSYVHDTVFAAFENGRLKRAAKTNLVRSIAGRERLLAQIVGPAGG
jgi:DNA topoisomerase-1